MIAFFILITLIFSSTAVLADDDIKVYDEKFNQVLIIRPNGDNATVYDNNFNQRYFIRNGNIYDTKFNKIGTLQGKGKGGKGK